MDPRIEARILEAVDREEILDLACRLIRVPSFSTQETPVAELLAAYLRARGYRVDLQEVEPGRLQTIATLKGGGGGRSLMLNGHTDINAITRGWKRDPWTPTIEGDRLYGAGARNMKGGLASIIGAAEAVRRSGVGLRGDLVVACVVGETQGGEGTHHLMQTGFRTDAAVVAEPFGLGNLGTVHAGIVHLAIHTYGVTGHVSRIEDTVNAVEKMAEVIRALRDVRFTFQPRDDLPAMPRLNVGSVIGGRGDAYVLVEPPYVPDLCTIIVDVHFLPGQTVQGIVADIERVLAQARRADPTLRCEIEVPPPEFFKGRRRLVMDPLDVPRDEGIVQAVARSHERVMGRPPRAIGAVLPSSYSANDTCHLWKAGIPCLIYGPGGGQFQDGADDQYALVGEMVDCARVLALTAAEVCETA